MRMSEFAEMKASEWHKGQRWGHLPYLAHLSLVAIEIEKHYPSTDSQRLEEMITAAWLHDSVEDCPEVKLKDVENYFGPNVSKLVWLLTDEPGINRKERKALTYVKTRACQDAVLLKICDRIANVRFSIGDKDPSFFRMYQKEQKDFESGLKTEGEWTEAWALLKKILKSR